MNVLLILAGIGLTIFGVRFLRKGLDRLFGGNIVVWISRTISNRIKSFIGGIAVGVVVSE